MSHQISRLPSFWLTLKNKCVSQQDRLTSLAHQREGRREICKMFITPQSQIFRLLQPSAEMLGYNRSNVDVEFPIRLWEPYVCVTDFVLPRSKYLRPETQMHMSGHASLLVYAFLKVLFQLYDCTSKNPFLSVYQVKIRLAVNDKIQLKQERRFTGSLR